MEIVVGKKSTKLLSKGFIFSLFIGIFAFSIFSSFAFAEPTFNEYETSQTNVTVQYNQNLNYGFQINITNITGSTVTIYDVGNATWQFGKPDSAYYNYTAANISLWTTFTNNTGGIWWINLTQEQLGSAGNYNITIYANNTEDVWNSSSTYDFVIAKASPVTVQYFYPSPATYGLEYMINDNITIPNGTDTFPEFITYINDTIYSNSSGLVAYYRFNNDTLPQDFIIDSSGNRNHGTLNDMNTTGNSTSGWMPEPPPICRFGDCMNFDGVDDRVIINDADSLDVTQAITITAWMYQKGSLGGSGTYPTILIKENAYWFSYDATNEGKIVFWIYNGTDWSDGVTTGSNSTQLKDKWSFVAATFDTATNTISSYEDGVLTDTATAHGDIAISASNVDLGGSTYGYFNGTIDDLRIYNRALTASDIWMLYEMGNGTYALSAGAYNVTTNTTGNANYSAVSDSDIFTVNKATTNVTLFLNGTEGNASYARHTPANITVTVNTSYTAVVNLTTNFTSTYNTFGNSPLENITTLSYSAGGYNITGFFEGDANFTSDSETYWLNITSPPTTTTTTTQPYSSGPSSPTASATPGKVVVYIPSIAAASKARVTIEETEEVDFTEINIQVINKVNSVYITIRKLDEKPTEIIQVPGEVYHYITIVKENIEDEDISTATMKFKVEKSWITDNNIDSATVTLNRFAAGKWNKLDTTKVNEDDDYIYYEAVTPGFSYFAIDGEIAGTVTTTVPATTTTIGPAATTTTAPIEPPELATETYIYIIVGIIIVAVLLVLWKTKILSPKKKRISH